MSESSLAAGSPITHIVKALGEEPLFKTGDIVFARILFQKGILTPDELVRKMDEVAAQHSAVSAA